MFLFTQGLVQQRILSYLVSQTEAERSLRASLKNGLPAGTEVHTGTQPREEFQSNEKADNENLGESRALTRAYRHGDRHVLEREPVSCLWIFQDLPFAT